jgi:hypothetical protein
VVAREKRARQRGENLAGLPMMLVTFEIEGQESACIDKNQRLPPYRYSS